MSAIRIRTMTAADIPLGMRLKNAAGWNQTEVDWRRLLDLEPAGCFVAESDSLPAGTACVTAFGPVAWISMVLVDPEMRKRGIGTRLMQHALEHLASRGIGTVRLDATAFGRPVYEKLGFAAEYDVARWEGTATGGCAAAGVVGAGPDDLPAIVALDEAAAGADRRRLIEHLYAEQPETLKVIASGGRVAGFSFVRTGTRAMQIGPVVAADAASGQSLADAALAACEGRPVFADVPVRNVAATRWAESHGLSIQRQFTRMVLGQPVTDQPTTIWASFGPEKG